MRNQMTEVESASQPDALPAELADQLAELLAEALMADLREFPNLVENKADKEISVDSPRGCDRRGAGEETVARPFEFPRSESVGGTSIRTTRGRRRHCCKDRGAKQTKIDDARTQRKAPHRPRSGRNAPCTADREDLDRLIDRWKDSGQ